jgi:hypothetical protein
MRRPVLLLLYLTCACGEVKSTTDGNPGGEMGPLHGPVTVTVTTDFGDIDANNNQLPIGIPLQGAQVFFVHDDGTYQLVTTGSDGVAASTDLGAPVTALVARRQGNAHTALTVFAAVPPTVHVAAGPRPAPLNHSNIGQVNFTVPGVANATGYRFLAACTDGSQSTTTPTIAFQLTDPCQRMGRTVAVEATDSAGAVVGFSQRTVDLVAGAQVALPALQAQTPFVANVSNIPVLANRIDVNTTFFDADQFLTSGFASATPTGTSSVVSVKSSPVGNHMLVSTSFNGSSGTTGYLINRHVSSHPSLVTTASIDAAGLMPFVTFPKWDMATRSASWSVNGNPGTPDIITARAAYNIATTGVGVDIRFYGPPGVTKVGLPSPMPNELASLAPGSGDSGFVDELMVIDVVGKNGYSAVVETADADARDAPFTTFGTGDEVWISDGAFK